jgi:D-alanyl-D-alanine carboxypeptidase/D-alanyl-D-alanine-endopeptidase (penicillin-binding protein 4)
MEVVALNCKVSKTFCILFCLLLAVPIIPVKAYEVDAVSRQEGLSQKLVPLIKKEPLLQGAIAGISVRSAKTGEILFEWNGNVRLRPASNMKILTAAAALSTLGEKHRFKTEVLTDGDSNGNVLKGNLYLKGKGDPTLLKEDFDHFAKELRRMGIEQIHGDIIGDDSWYDDVRLSQDVIWSDETAYYGAQVSALTASPNQEYDAGTVLVEISPGKRIGDKAVVHMTPKNNYIRILNHGITVSPDSASECRIQREHGSNIIVVQGMIPLQSNKKREWVAVWEPTGYALNLFGIALTEQGIQWTGKVRTEKTPQKAKILLTHKSLSLVELLTPFLKLSNNGHGEILVKEMGKVLKNEGSWEKGIEVIEEQLPKFGVNSQNIVIRDGSGISHLNLISANEISSLLFHIQKEPWFPPFLNALPVAGKQEKFIGGTLKSRMSVPPLAGNVKAKTGTLTTVSCLSGYITINSGERLAFSILLNNLLDEEKGKDFEDRLMLELANY